MQTFNRNPDTRLFETEMQRLFPMREKQRARPLACIYIGRCDQGRVYVGQTVTAPENRWLQHRDGSTGPFKKGVQYVRWEVVEGGIDPSKLNERESYYIGFYDAYKNGYNETQGNDWLAYERGLEDRNKLKSSADAIPATGGSGIAGHGQRNPSSPASWGKVSRNEPCPCGSGKRFKHCHGKFT